MPVKYVFWDSDNTLVKTYVHHWHKHLEVLKEHGIDLEDRWKERIYSNNGSQNWEWLHEELGLKVERNQYLNEIDTWYHRHIESIEIREGIIDALELFKSNNIPMAVVSNGRTRSVIPALTAKGLIPYFKFTLCKEDYEGRKPEAAPYLAAKTRMQQILGHAIDAGDCLVIEDDPKGVESGVAAGMKVVHRGMDDDDTDGFLATLKNLK